MVMVDVDSQLKSVGLVWGLAATQHSVCIHQMNRVNSHNGSEPWWQHHKYYRVYYYYYYYVLIAIQAKKQQNKERLTCSLWRSTDSKNSWRLSSSSALVSSFSALISTIHLMAAQMQQYRCTYFHQDVSSHLICKVCLQWFDAVDRAEGRASSLWKNWVVGLWCDFLSGVRCRFAYGPADVTATHYLLFQ